MTDAERAMIGDGRPVDVLERPGPIDTLRAAPPPTSAPLAPQPPASAG